MYDKATVLEVAVRLADRVGKIRTGILDSSLYGLSNQDLQRQELRHRTGELVHGINSGWEVQAHKNKTNQIEGSLQTAAVTGLIGDKDLQEYLGMIDDIYAALDQTN